MSPSSKSRRSPLRERLFGSVTQEIVRRAGNISVHVISGEERRVPAPRPIATRQASDKFKLKPYFVSTGLVLVALGCGVLLSRVLDVQNVALVFLTAVLVSAVAFGLWPAIFASLLSVFAFNVLFLPPHYSITVADPENVVALFFFLVVALIASNLTASVRCEAPTRCREPGGSSYRCAPFAARSASSASTATRPGRSSRLTSSGCSTR